MQLPVSSQHLTFYGYFWCSSHVDVFHN